METTNLACLGSHTVDVDLLPERPTVLDVGARGFGFVRELLELRPLARVLALEPDPSVRDPGIPNVAFHAAALVHDDRRQSRYAAFSTGEANFLAEMVPDYAQCLTVPCINLRELMDEAGIEYWDLVKLDCEGSEFGILENWPGPIATQISVEFHDFQNRGKWNAAYFAALFSGPLKDYKVVQHELTGVGPDNTLGHWDSLLALR